MLNSKRTIFFVFIFSSIAFSLCTDKTVFKKIDFKKFDLEKVKDFKSAKSEKQKCVMTVFIHGTTTHRFLLKSLGNWLKREWALKILNKIFWKKTDKEREEIFKKYVDWLDRYIEKMDMSGFCIYQPIGPIGLSEIDQKSNLRFCDKEYFGTKTVKLYEKVYNMTHKDHKNILKYYSYDWSGVLSSSGRLDASRDLYKVLVSESKKLSEEFGLPVEINLLGHSHGSNVILFLAKIEKELKKKLFIDKAILVAGPVQSETEKFVNSKVFGRVYNVYSKGDFIQVGDFISTKDFFSRRRFGYNEKKPVRLKNNLRQIEVELGKLKPSHYEMWLWGGRGIAYFLYRNKLSFHPLPVSIFLPIITAMADSIDVKNDEKKLCRFNFYCEKDWFLMTGYENGVLSVIDFDDFKKEGLICAGLTC